MFEEVNKNSEVKFTQNYGDIMSLNEFVECCEDNSFIDYDGFANEIILGDKIIYNERFYPSDVLDYKSRLLGLQKELGDLKVVWYNR